MTDIQESLKAHGVSAEDWDADLTMHAHGGFAVGDAVTVIEDHEEMGIFCGGQGELLAFYTQLPGLWNPIAYIGAIVSFDGMEPMGIPLTKLGSEDDLG